MESSSLKVFRLLYFAVFGFVLLTFFAVPVWYLLPYFLLCIPMLTIEESRKNYVLYGISYVVSNLVIMVLLRGIVYRSIICSVIMALVVYSDRLSKKEKTSIGYVRKIFYALFPFIIMFIVECMQGNLSSYFKALFPAFVTEDVRLVYQNLHILMVCYTVVFLWVFYYTFSLLIDNKMIAILVVSIPILILGFANMMVIGITHNPLAPGDILTVGTALNSIKGQSFSLELLKWVGMACGLMGVYVLIVYKIFKGYKLTTSKKYFKFVTMAFCTGLLCSFLGNMELLNFRANYKYGYICYFINDAQGGIKKPNDFSETYVSTKAKGEVSDGVSEKTPNVIVVMSEAFSDLEGVYGVETSEEVIPYFNSLKEKYPSGKVYSSVFGNNTVSSEFEFLTGISTGLTAKGADMYQRYLKKASEFYTLGSYYQEMGYDTCFFHPASKANYNRGNMYEMMGYDKTIFLEDMGEDLDCLRNYVTDEEDYSTVLNLVEDTENPLFLMNVTMQNHAMYNEELSILPYINITNSSEKYTDVENYLTLLKKSDDSLKNLLGALEKSDEPTVVLLFGDHQPMVTDAFYSEYLGESLTGLGLEEKAQTYEIPYLLWSNYDIDEARGCEFELPEKTSMIYLSVLLNSYMGMEGSDWLFELEELRGIYPVITENFAIDAEGGIVSMDDIRRGINEGSSELKGLESLRDYWFTCYTMVTKGGTENGK